VVELFHPRRHAWPEHFARNGAQLVGRTIIGKATVHLLKLNAPERIEEREQ